MSTIAYSCSGGAAKGAYGVGVLKHLIVDLKLKIDVFAGVSVGALIAGHQCQFHHNSAQLGYEDLEDLFLTVKTSDIWRHWWPFRELSALWKPSLYDSTPLEDLIQRRLQPDRIKWSGRKLRVGAVSLTTGKYEVFDETHVPLTRALAASSAMPFGFKPVRMGGEWWTDGGVRTITPIKSAIDAGADIVVAVTLSPKGHPGEFDPDPEAIDVAVRSIECVADEVVAKDIRIAQLHTYIAELEQKLKDVDETLLEPKPWPPKRPVQVVHVRPSLPLLPDSTRFVPEEAARIHEIGYRDAVRELEGVEF